MNECLSILSPLIRHLCPEGNYNLLECDVAEVWDLLIHQLPVSRTIVPASKAIASIENLKVFASNHRLTNVQLSLVGALLVTLLRSTTLYSPIRSCDQPQHFESLLQCLLPQKTTTKFLVPIIYSLLEHAHTERQTIAILNLAHLVVLNCTQCRSPQQWSFLWMHVFKGRLPAIRVVWYLKFLPTYRRSQLKRYSQGLDDNNHHVRVAVHDLLQRFSTTGTKQCPAWLEFGGSKAWKQDFLGPSLMLVQHHTHRTLHCVHAPPRLTTQTASAMLSNAQFQQWQILTKQLSSNDDDGLSYKLHEQWQSGDRLSLMQAMQDCLECTGGLSDVVVSFARLYMLDDLLSTQRYSLVGRVVRWTDLPPLFHRLATHFGNETAIHQRRMVQELLVPLLWQTDSPPQLTWLVKETDSMCRKALMTDSDESLRETVLLFFQSAARVATETKVLFGLSPSPTLVRWLFFSPTLLGLEGLCRLLVQLDPIREEMRQQEQYPDEVDRINQYIAGVQSALWTTCAPLPDSFLVDHLGDQARETLNKAIVAGRFSFTHGVCFASVAKEFCNQNGYESVDQIRGQETKMEYLMFLQMHGWSGIHSLVSESI